MLPVATVDWAHIAVVVNINRKIARQDNNSMPRAPMKRSFFSIGHLPLRFFDTLKNSPQRAYPPTYWPDIVEREVSRAARKLFIFYFCHFGSCQQWDCTNVHAQAMNCRPTNENRIKLARGAQA